MLKSIGKQSGNAWRSGAQHSHTAAAQNSYIMVYGPPSPSQTRTLLITTLWDAHTGVYIWRQSRSGSSMSIKAIGDWLTDWLAGLVWRKALLRAVHSTLRVAAPRAGKNVSPVFSTSKPQPISDRSTVQVNALHRFRYSRVFRYLFYCDI